MARKLRKAHRFRFLQALPPYWGGKRLLLGEIFRRIPPPAEAPVLVDAFAGGGAVSLFGKARGYRVLANDLAPRACITGRALLVNDRVRLAPSDVTRLFAPAADAGRVARDHLAPRTLTDDHAAFFDTAMANARAAAGVKRDLLQLLLVHYLCALQPAGTFGSRGLIRQVAERDFDGANAAFLRGPWLRRMTCHPRDELEGLRQRINAGVFAGAAECAVNQGDAAEFLSRTQADIAYFDPPYAGTLAYETALRPLDELLAGHVLEPEKSRFSTADWRDAMTQLFDSARHIRRWVLSFSNAATDLDELVALMRRFKPRVEAEAIEYAHCVGLASADSRATNREFVITGSDS